MARALDDRIAIALSPFILLLLLSQSRRNAAMITVGIATYKGVRFAAAAIAKAP